MSAPISRQNLPSGNIGDWVMGLEESERSQLIDINESESDSDICCCCDHLISHIDNSLEALSRVADAVMRCWTRCIRFYTNIPAQQ